MCIFVAAAAVQKLANPKEFFTACYHALLCCTDTPTSDSTAITTTSSSSTAQPPSSSSSSSATDRLTQQLCVKAMAAAYSAHAGTIGPFEGVPHLLQLLDSTQQRSLRHGLLLLLQALVAPSAAGDLSALNAPPAAAGSSSLGSTAAGSIGNTGGTVSRGGTTALSVNTGSAAAAAAVGRGVRLSRLPAGQQAAVKAAKANGYLLMDHGGLQLLVDFVAGAVAL